jgi:hypothetical protein
MLLEGYVKFLSRSNMNIIGEGKIVAVCTLPSMDLFQTIARTADVMNRILIVGRLLSENKGILYPIIISVSVLIQVKSFPSLPHR